jgi:predicted phage terminase large subunit-like protein
MSNELDEQIAKLSDEKNITAARKKSESKFTELTTDQWKYLRKRCKLDLFFLANGVLGYNKLSVNLHGDLCHWLMRNQTHRFKIVLLPRSHFKSTIATISHAVQIVLPDDTNGVAPWPECLGTNARLLIGHETAEQASKFLISVAGHYMSNPLLMGLFPETVPSLKKQRINKYELELPRTEIWNEATVDTMGVGGKTQGRHYDYLKLDDLIGDKARDSKAEMGSAKDWIDNIQAFFTEFTRAKFDVVGTRWAFDDLYSHLFTSYGPALLKYIRGAEERDTETGEIRPIFPEAFTIESFKILKKNKKIWSAQYANDPESATDGFDKSWLRFYSWIGYNKLCTGEEETRQVYDVMDLDRCILIDPAVHGKSGILVTAGTSDDKQFIVEATKKELKPPEMVDYLFKLVSRWQPRLVAIESVNFSALYEHWLKTEMQVRGIRFNVIPVKTGNREKEARVRGLANYFAAGAVHFHQSQDDLITEYNHFGATEDYHMLDALAYGPEVWSKPFSKARWDDFRAAEMELLSERSPITGY